MNRSIATLAILAALGACDRRGRSRDACGVEEAALSASSRQTLEQALRVQLPATSGPVHHEIEHGIDTGVWVRATIACAEIPALRRALGLETAPTREADRAEMSGSCPWWRPQDLAGGASAHAIRNHEGRSFGATLAWGAPDAAGGCAIYVFQSTL